MLWYYQCVSNSVSKDTGFVFLAENKEHTCDYIFPNPAVLYVFNGGVELKS
jgi:hypothetical protein